MLLVRRLMHVQALRSRFVLRLHEAVPMYSRTNARAKVESLKSMLAKVKAILMMVLVENVIAKLCHYEERSEKRTVAYHQFTAAMSKQELEEENANRPSKIELPQAEMMEKHLTLIKSSRDNRKRFTVG